MKEAKTGVLESGLSAILCVIVSLFFALIYLLMAIAVMTFNVGQYLVAIAGVALRAVWTVVCMTCNLFYNLGVILEMAFVRWWEAIMSEDEEQL